MNDSVDRFNDPAGGLFSQPASHLAFALIAACGGTSIQNDPLERYEAETARSRNSIAVASSSYVDDEGPGWRLREGVFESAVTALRVRAGGPWFFREDFSDSPAEFALSYGDGALIATRVRLFGTDANDQIASIWDGYASTMRAIAESAQIPLGDTMLEARRYSSGETGFFVALHAALDSVWVIQLVFPAHRPEPAKAALERLPPLETLEGNELDSLRNELLTRIPTRLAEGASLRGRIFHHFDEGVRLELPSAFWNVTLSRGALLLAEDPETRLRFTLGHTLADPDDVGAQEEDVARNIGEAAHEALRAQLGGEVGAATSVVFGGIPGLVSEADYGEGLLARRKRAISVLRNTSNGTEIIWWIVEAPPASFAAMTARITRLENSVSFVEPSEPILQSGSHIEDHRLGIAFDVPNGFVLTALNPPFHGAYLLRESGRDATSEITVFGFARQQDSVAHRERVVARLIEQYGPPESTEARSVRWPNRVRVDALMAGDAAILVVDLSQRDLAASLRSSLSPLEAERDREP